MRGSTGHVRRGVEVLLPLGLGGIYALAVARMLQGRGSTPLLAAILLPLAAAPLLVLRRSPIPRPQGMVLGACATVTTALLAAAVISAVPLAALALPVLALAAIACARFPAAGVTAAFLVAGAFGSLAAFTPLSGQQVADLLLAGLWLGAIWGWVMSGRRRPAWVWPGIALLGFYLLLTAFEVLAADTLTMGFQSFRASAWYMAAALLVAYAPWSDAARARLLRGALLAIALIAGYAVMRWAVGPAGAERTQAEGVANNFLDGELRPVGSFVSTKQMAAWMAVAIPFAAGVAIAGRGRLRLIAAAALALAVLAMFAADVRAGPAAAVPGVVAVLLLYQLSQAFRGRRGPALPVAVALCIVLGGGAFALTLGGDNASQQRYGAILHPEQDSSYQARLFKWRTAIGDIERAPFGRGLGTSGDVQKRYGRFTNIGSIDVDNSYLKIAYEQGFFVMGLFAAALALLLVGLSRRAVVTLDPARAGPALAACGVLVAMAVLFGIGTYVEGLQVLGGWLLVGLGLSQFTGAVGDPGGGQASAE